jgi:hypothetical protein
MTISIQKPTTGTLNCPVPGKTYQVGNPKSPSPTDFGDRLIDGEHGASIKCSVHGSGPYTFSGTIKGTSSEKDPVTLTITSGVVNADKTTGTATVAVYTPQLAGTFSSAEGACTITVVGQQIKAGSVWATIACDSVTSSSTGQGCSIGPVSSTITTFVLENCDGS